VGAKEYLGVVVRGDSLRPTVRRVIRRATQQEITEPEACQLVKASRDQQLRPGPIGQE